MAQTAQRHQCAQSPTTPTLHFCPLEAEAIGLNEAIIVARVRFWLGRSKNIFGGQPWIYNTYPDWQKQFSFWSTFTVKGIFRRLERLGVLESTQHYNASRWNKTKWYTLNEEVLAEMMGNPVVPNAVEPVVAEAVEIQAVAMGADVAIDGQQTPAIDGIDAATIDGCDIVPSLTVRSSKIINTKSACASEPDAGARTHALETTKPVVTGCHHRAASMPASPSSPEMPVTPVTPAEEASDLDAAYALIPEAERETWCERADRALEAAGMPEWVRIAPTVREMALRLWVGGAIPGVATG